MKWHIENDRMEGREIRRLMRVHKVTIREFAQRIQIYQKRIRYVCEHGLQGRELIWDWLQGILGEDPGPVWPAPPSAAWHSVLAAAVATVLPCC